MDFKEIMMKNTGYCSMHTDMPGDLQQKAKELCWEYNQTRPSEQEKRSKILTY